MAECIDSLTFLSDRVEGEAEIAVKNRYDTAHQSKHCGSNRLSVSAMPTMMALSTRKSKSLSTRLTSDSLRLEVEDPLSSRLIDKRSG
jgi:hypothetical protein